MYWEPYFGAYVFDNFTLNVPPICRPIVCCQPLMTEMSRIFLVICYFPFARGEQNSLSTQTSLPRQQNFNSWGSNMNDISFPGFDACRYELFEQLVGSISHALWACLLYYLLEGSVVQSSVFWSFLVHIPEIPFNIYHVYYLFQDKQ